jgi:hypothetical protein
MKASLLVKFGLILPLLLLADYVVMVLIGCSSCLFGVGEDFNCNSYCIAGKILLLVSAVFFIYLILPDLKKLVKHEE